MLRRRARPEPKVILIGKDGQLQPWQIRAGMVITETIYDHERRRVIAVVETRKHAPVDG